MKIHLLSGFLGSGKTTAIQQAATALLKQGSKVGVITNDQGIRLVDGGFFTTLNIPGRQVVNGCFCCKYNDLDAGIQSLVETNQTEIIFAESVGSCTDIVATVLKPLLQFRPGVMVTFSTFADIRLLQMILEGKPDLFDETVNYIYLKQLEEARIIVINKIDMVSPEKVETVKKLMRVKYGNKMLLYQNSLDEDNVRTWISILEQSGSADNLQSPVIDYDRYADGEARLAWLDENLEIISPGNDAVRPAEDIINTVYTRIKGKRYPIGHIKFLVNGVTKISFSNSLQPLAKLEKQEASSMKLLLNIRVQTTPENIRAIVAEAIGDVQKRSACIIKVSGLSAFRPGYPRPLHRM